MKFRDFHPNIQIRIIISFFGGLMSVMVIPLMSVYFSQRLGAGMTGFLLFLNVVAGLVSGFCGGYISDRIGRKRLMVIAEAGILASYALAAASNSPWFESVWLTYVSILGVNVCWGIFGPSSDAMILDVSRPEERKYIYTIQYWSHNLSSAIGGMIGALLFQDYLFELLLALTAMGILSTAATLFLIRETFSPELAARKQEQAAGWRDLLRSYRMVLADRTFVFFVTASMLFISVEFHLGNYVSVRLADSMPVQHVADWFGRSISMDGFAMIGALRTENTLLVVLLSLLARQLLGRIRDSHMLYGGLALYVCGYAFISYSDRAWPLLIAMLIATLGEVVYVPVQQAFLGDIPPKESRSTYMAFYGLSFQGAWMISSLMVMIGGLLQAGVIGLLVLSCGAGGILMMVAIMRELRQRRATAE
ncbi:MDR family MFS transporter [Gorillibacterium sp. sgz5001074]|uniref:MDR family MFS transporter n=1 Tax=Gorillibacterium sp. sgz5001074 TaxID=3446695 RepID=UPI003F681BFB